MAAPKMHPKGQGPKTDGSPEGQGPHTPPKTPDPAVAFAYRSHASSTPQGAFGPGRAAPASQSGTAASSLRLGGGDKKASQAFGGVINAGGGLASSEPDLMHFNWDAFLFKFIMECVKDDAYVRRRKRQARQMAAHNEILGREADMAFTKRGHERDKTESLRDVFDAIHDMLNQEGFLKLAEKGIAKATGNQKKLDRIAKDEAKEAAKLEKEQREKKKSTEEVFKGAVDGGIKGFRDGTKQGARNFEKQMRGLANGAAHKAIARATEVEKKADQAVRATAAEGRGMLNQLMHTLAMLRGG